jgi:hypothetical protein
MSQELTEQYVMESPIVMPLTASGIYEDPYCNLRVLFREGILTTLLMFFFCAIPSIYVGTGFAARTAISVAAFLISLIGIFSARTYAGRIFQALAFNMFIEYKFAFQLVPLSPSLILLLVAMVWERARPTGPFYLTSGNQGLRSLMVFSVWALFGFMFVAAVVNLGWLQWSIYGLMNRQIPTLLFALASAAAFRKGYGGILLDLMIPLASVVAFSVWAYAQAGIWILTFRDYLLPDELDRFGGLLRNGNNAAFFCVVVALLGFLRLRVASPVLKIFYVLNSLFMVGTILVLRSRGPLLLLAGVGTFVFLRKGLKKWGVLAVFLGVLGYMLFGGSLSATQRENAVTLRERLDALQMDIMARLAIYRDTLTVAASYPLGTGQVTGVQSKVAITATQQESHNEYLGFLMQNGFQSLLPAAVIFAGLTANWFSVKIKRLPYRPGAELNTLVICFITTFFYEPIYNNCVEMAMFWGVVLGMFTASLIYAGPQPMDMLEYDATESTMTA